MTEGEIKRGMEQGEGGRRGERSREGLWRFGGMERKRGERERERMVVMVREESVCERNKEIARGGK